MDNATIFGDVRFSILSNTVIMKLLKIDKNSRDLSIFRDIYLEAFPPEERPPFSMILKRAGRPGVDFLGIYEEEHPVGFVYVVSNEDIAYIFFLAIRKEERGNGYGSQVLRALTEKYAGRNIFLAIEQMDPTAENYEQRLKRHSFYESCGFHDLPARLREASVIYDTMGTGGSIEPSAYRRLMDAYMGRFMRIVVGMKLIPKTTDES